MRGHGLRQAEGTRSFSCSQETWKRHIFRLLRACDVLHPGSMDCISEASDLLCEA